MTKRFNCVSLNLNPNLTDWEASELKQDYFVDKFNSFNNKVDAEFEFLQEEIDIRNESLKIELDKICNKLKTQLDEKKLHIK